MGYSKDEFHFLERAPNVVFLCSSCLPDAQKSLKCDKTAPEVVQDVADLKQTVEAVKAMVRQLVQNDKRPPKTEAKYSDIVKNVSDYALEVRFSGIPEMKSRKNENT